jgi:hypothetical protein
MAAQDLNERQLLHAVERMGRYIGTVIATTTAKDNSNTTGTTFTIPAGALVAVQPDGACYVSGEFPAATITSSNSRLVGANEYVTGFIWGGSSKLAVKAVADTVNCKVFQLHPGL